MKMVFCILYLILSTNSLYASSDDHTMFSIGDSYIEIRWGMDVDGFHELGHVYEIFSLIASNYDIIYKQKKHIFFRYEKEGDKYLLDYSIDNKQAIKIYSGKFSKSVKVIKKVLIDNFNLKDNRPESINLLLLGMPSSRGNKNPDYNRFVEFYFGPAPGIMQIKDNGQWYHIYVFFKDENVLKLIKQDKLYRAILIRKNINRNNIGEIVFY